MGGIGRALDLHLLHFWRWEFRFFHTALISLPVYLYIIGHMLLLLYLVCALLFPENNSDTKNYRALIL